MTSPARSLPAVRSMTPGRLLMPFRSLTPSRLLPLGRLLPLAVLAAALAAPPARAANPLAYELAGQITDAEALTFAVINGNRLSSNPEPGDLPLAYTATLAVPGGVGSAGVDFSFSGSFTSPNRAYTFDIDLVGFPVDVLVDDAGTLQLVDSLFVDDNVAFNLTLDKATGLGTWDWFEGSVVPSRPPRDRSAAATSGVARLVIPEPAASVLAMVALAGLSRRR